MARIELIPTRNSDGTIALRAVPLGLRERVRRLLRKHRRPPGPRSPSRPLAARA